MMSCRMRWRRAVAVSAVVHVFLLGAVVSLPGGTIAAEEYVELELVTERRAGDNAPAALPDSSAEGAAAAPAEPAGQRLTASTPAAASADYPAERAAAAGWPVAACGGDGPAVSPPSAAIAGPAAPAGRSRPDNAAALAELFVRRLEAKKEYPYIARQRGQTGTVRVRIYLTPEGNLGEASVAASSGVTRLDEAALKLVRAACPFSHGLGRPLVITVPITYDLKEQ